LRPSNTEFRQQDLAVSNSKSQNVDDSSILDKKDAILHNLGNWLADRPSIEQVSGVSGGGGPAPLKKGKLNRGIFGVPLDEVYARGGGSSVPIIVIQSVDFLLGLGENKLEGIFRIPGNRAKINKLKEAYATPKTKVNLSGEDMHDVAGTLKAFFSELPDPIFPFNTYNDFVSIARKDTAEERNPLYIEALGKLPDLNGIVIRFFFEFLYQVAQGSNLNKMTPANLGTCLGPTLLRPLRATAEQMMLAVEKDVVDHLVTDYNSLFDSVGMGTVSKSLLKNDDDEGGGKKKKKLMSKMSSKRFTSNFQQKDKVEGSRATSSSSKFEENQNYPPGKERPTSFHSVNLEQAGRSNTKTSLKSFMKKK